MRVFVGIRLAPELHAAAENLRRTIEPHVDPGSAKWIASTDLHLTLKFLGSIDNARIPGLAGKLAEVARAHSAFHVAYAGVGAFPRAGAARALWTGVHDCPALGLLAEALESALEPQGFARETREYSPHLTLARFREPARLASLLRALNEASSLGSQPVDRFELLESRPGANYRTIASFALAPKPANGAFSP